MTKKKSINSSIHDYTISFEKDMNFIVSLLDEPNAIFIIDANVHQLYKHLFLSLEGRQKLILLDAIEENKTLAAAEKIYDKIIALQPTKKTKIVSIGGGITQDVTGFVASTFYRGLNWTYLPTTLLAQADSCMGSKTSLNYKSYKNILGTFYPPHAIHIVAEFTNSLSEEDFYSGMGEVAKLHAMGGASSFQMLSEKLSGVYERDIATITFLTKSSLDIKWTYMDGDEFDQGKRNMLNYGHEFGHAIETATNYKIPHGQAILIGMVMANEVAYKKGHLARPLNDKLNKVFIELLKSNYKQLVSIDDNSIVAAMKQDKKRIGKGLPLIMMNNNYDFFKILDLTEEEAVDAIEYFKSTYCN